VMATILDVHQAIVRRMPPEEQRMSRGGSM
jgi:hypothetical protein